MMYQNKKIMRNKVKLPDGFFIGILIYFILFNIILLISSNIIFLCIIGFFVGYNYKYINELSIRLNQYFRKNINE